MWLHARCVHCCGGGARGALGRGAVGVLERTEHPSTTARVTIEMSANARNGSGRARRRRRIAGEHCHTFSSSFFGRAWARGAQERARCGRAFNFRLKSTAVKKCVILTARCPLTSTHASSGESPGSTHSRAAVAATAAAWSLPFCRSRPPLCRAELLRCLTRYLVASAWARSSTGLG